MTTVELRTSIAAELDQMSAEMLESVSRYVSRLRRRARTTRRVSSVQGRREAAMLFVKDLSVQGGMPVPADESGIENLFQSLFPVCSKRGSGFPVPLLILARRALVDGLEVAVEGTVGGKSRF